MVAAFEKTGVYTGVDPFAVMDVAQETVRPIQPSQGIIDRDGLMLGYAGVYGSFLLHVTVRGRMGVPHDC